LVEDAIKKLEPQVEALFTLTLNAFVRFRFLRPMLDNRELLDRIEQENKAVGFNQLRNWLYWGLVLELAKLCHDNVKQKRAPSIYAIRKKLSNRTVVKALRDNYANRGREVADANEAKREFSIIYRRFCKTADWMLSTRVAGGFKTIRDKPIAHNELRKDGKFHDVKDQRLNYGDEHALLKIIQALVTDLMTLVRGTDIASIWHQPFEDQRQMTSEFWGL
jgi:AbiU2